MRKPNNSLKFMAHAVSAQRKAQLARSASLRAFYSRRAQEYLSAAAKAADVVAAVRIIKASNQEALRTVAAAAKRRSVKASEFDCIDDVNLMNDEVIDVDADLDDDVMPADDLGIVAANEKEDDDADDADDTEEQDEDDKEVDSRVAAILSRARKFRVSRARR